MPSSKPTPSLPATPSPASPSPTASPIHTPTETECPIEQQMNTDPTIQLVSPTDCPSPTDSPFQMPINTDLPCETESLIKLTIETGNTEQAAIKNDAPTLPQIQKGSTDMPSPTIEFREETDAQRRGGIARRVHLRNDRKRKIVKTPFIAGDRKKKKAQLANDEVENVSKKETSITGRKPVTRASTRLKEKLTDTNKASTPKNVAPSAAVISDAAPIAEKPKTAIYDDDDSKTIERPAMAFLEYPG
ncbi:putative uncharacterized protein DDB_G0290521 [Dendrobium catenatum]|uniref:putative uncharacterized protein DDB_G0290521 n=1 Tax=Dendrobium catenatum TaxID=906689 RepID=UPI0009F2E6B4|nr:putative uncharacterized protein DDB_G0290521 [Dendrobium catenatum]